MAQVEIVNNFRDRISFDVPVYGADGEQARDAQKKLKVVSYILGSSLDANAGDDVPKPRLRLDERLWDTLKDKPTFRGLLSEGRISVYNVRK